MQEEKSLFVILFTVYNLLLKNLSNQNSILSAVTFSGRKNEESQKIIGLFINTLLFKVKVLNTNNLRDIMNAVELDLLEAYEFEEYPIENILNDYDLYFPDVVKAFFLVQNFPTARLANQLDNLEPEHLEFVNDSKLDFGFYVSEIGNTIRIECQYRKALFKPKTIEKVLDTYSKMVELFIDHVDIDFMKFKGLLNSNA